MRAYNKIGCESVSGRRKDKNVIHAELPKKIREMREARETGSWRKGEETSAPNTQIPFVRCQWLSLGCKNLKLT